MGDYLEQQLEELEALESIYPEEYKGTAQFMRYGTVHARSGHSSHRHGSCIHHAVRNITSP